MSPPTTRIEIDIPSQRLTLLVDGEPVRSWPVSTAKNGPGEMQDSECTPRGRHEISGKIGSGAAPNTVFVGRRPTGECYSEALANAHPGRDWILTRILWLAGLEPGFNAGGRCDTKSRYIYIHGTPDSEPMGQAKSHGCIRMRNADIVDLYSKIEPGTPVEIKES